MALDDEQDAERALLSRMLRGETAITASFALDLFIQSLTDGLETVAAIEIRAACEEDKKIVADLVANDLEFSPVSDRVKEEYVCFLIIETLKRKFPQKWGPFIEKLAKAADSLGPR